MQSLGRSMRVLAATQAVLLVLGLGRAEAAVLSNEISADKIIYEMDIDDLIDENMETIKNVAADLDPFKLDDINFPVTKFIYMHLHTGWAQNLAQMQRAGNCKIRYASKKLDMDLNFGWDDLAFDYRYLMKVFPLTREGDMHVQMTKLNVRVALKVDLKNYHVTLEKLQLREKGKINISLEGHALDHIYNLAIKAATRVFRTITLNTIRDKMREMIVHRIDEINFQLGQMINGRRFTFADLTAESPINYDDDALDDNDNNIHRD